MSSSLENPQFLLRRLHSLFGLLPVGAFLIFHLWENSQSRFGAAHYNLKVVGALQELNYLPLLEIFVIALPIAFHAGYGVHILFTGRAEPRRYPWLHNYMYLINKRYNCITPHGYRKCADGNEKTIIKQPGSLAMLLLW